jgi:hypothetical protein
MTQHNFVTAHVVLNLGQDEFTERDVEVFKRYLTFAGIGESI